MSKLCSKHKCEMVWQTCENCEDGFAIGDHDCGEDTCACLDPEDNVECSTCDGESGWYYCEECVSEEQKLAQNKEGK